MKIRLLNRFKKTYKKLTSDMQKKVNKSLVLLLSDQKHPSLRVRKMESAPSVWHLRVDRNYRLIFEFGENGIYVLRNVGRHGSTLNNP